MAQVFRHAFGQYLGLHRLEQTFLVGPPEPSGVHGDQHVGRAVSAFGDDAFDQLVAAALDQIDGDPRLLREVVVQRQVRVVVARGVDVDLLGRRDGAGARHGRAGGQYTKLCPYHRRLPG